MNANDTQRISALRKQLGLDNLDALVTQGVSEVSAIGARMTELLTPSEQFSAAALERLAHFDELVSEEKLVEAYQYGQAAIKISQPYHLEITEKRTYAFAMIGTAAENYIEAIHETTDRIEDEIQGLAPDMRSVLSNEATKCAHPIYEMDNRLMNALLKAAEHAFDASKLNNLQHDLREIERKAERLGITLPEPSDIKPLAPLPPLNTHWLQHAEQRPSAPANKQSPSL
jgi:ElaB/YqjD/DUF883 family membrane-anchored ribosome-binding protein